MSIEIYNAAIKYQKMGFIIHPLSSPNDKNNSPGKKPLLSNWQNIESVSEDNIKNWFLNTNNNIGLQCGFRSKLTVIDFDHELFKDEIFNGFELNTLISGRTNGRGHIYFKHNPMLKSSKHHDLGIEVLSNGSNAVMPPSIHKSGDRYKWVNPDAPIMEMPEKVIQRLNNLFRTETELKQIISKCRHCFRDILKNKPNVHGAEGREYMIAVCTDIKSVKDERIKEPIANESHIKMFAKLMYGKDYDEKKTLQEWRNIDPTKTWTCETLKQKLSVYINLSDCDECEERRKKYQEFKTINKKESLKSNYHFTDLGNARRIKDTYGNDIHFCYPTNQWLVWNGTKWDTDNEAYIETCARGIVKQIYDEAFVLEDYEKRQDMIKFALKCESNKSIKNMIELSKSELGIPILPNRLDKDTMLFNVQNGTIDLRTGVLKPHTKVDMITKISPVVFDAESPCPIWEAFLNKIFDNNKEIIEYLQRKAGYILTGETSEEEFDELHGTGGNGKSKFVNEIAYILGEYSIKANVETIQAASDRTSGNAASSDVARLKGARLVIVSEPEKGTILNEHRVKDWTGRDPITARHLYQEPITFIPEFKLWIYTNYKLRIKGTDNGIWRRIKLIPFEVTISEDEQDKILDKKLLKESSGILNWMIEGCLKWQQSGLKVPQCIIDATNEYRTDQDYLGEFFRQCCDVEKGKKVSFQSIFLVYRSYCILMDMTPQGRIGFIDTLESKKFKGVKEKTGKFYHGFDLKPEISLKCEQIISGYGDVNGDGVTEVTQFLETFLNQFSCRKSLETASPASPASPNQPVDNETNEKTKPKNDKHILEKTSDNNNSIINNKNNLIDFGTRAKDWMVMNCKSITNETKIEASMWIAESIKCDPSDVCRYLEKAYGLTPGSNK